MLGVLKLTDPLGLDVLDRTGSPTKCLNSSGVDVGLGKKGLGELGAWEVGVEVATKEPSNSASLRLSDSTSASISSFRLALSLPASPTTDD